MTRRQSLGRWGENLAAAYLTAHGYTIMGQNVRTPYGEFDLIAHILNVIVFVEVKTRSSRSLGPPEISIGPRKQLHLLNAAAYYMQKNPQLSCDWRIDVIAIEHFPGDSQPAIQHFENALSGA